MSPLKLLYQWLLTAKPGERLKYHRGFLARDRIVFDWIEQKTRNVPDVDDLARRVWINHKLGFVTLFQRKVGPGDYEYFAVRTSKRM